MQSAIYTGSVYHSRLVPKKHDFSYKIFLLWLNLDELDLIEDSVKGFSAKSWAPLRFKRSDYLGDVDTSLKQSVIDKMSELAHQPLAGTVYLLGQTRTFGLYFSPVNFYYLKQKNDTFSHLLAEVSNTPWNNRHCYLVDLSQQEDCQKVFHVSPFNPMDMVYKWKVSQPEESLTLTLSCHKEVKHFAASLNLSRVELNSKSLLNVLLSIPSMTLKTVFGIYWQAFKLFIKGVPFYSNSAQGKK
ncbi:MAG: DUF1365 family protein [Paraglaciecola sp.]|jgi:DUF1365 family protein